MKKVLEMFQVEGARALASNYHHLLADVPGLGKTLQAIAAVETLGLKDILVVCPASVRTGWQQEIEECLGSCRGWQIISYQGASNGQILAEMKEHNDAIILDEGHFLKTVDSQRTRAIFGSEVRDGFDGLARRATYKWVLTGTPVLNRPRELFPILKSLHPAFAEMSFATFAQKFCGAYFDGYGINTKGATNLEELALLLSPFMTRRTKAEVFPGRKEPDIRLVPIDVTAADLALVRAEEELILDREAFISAAKEEVSQLGDLSHLLRLTGEAKVPAICAYLEDMLETIPKVVVFFHHTEVGRRIYTRLAARGCNPVIYQGGMSDGQKDAAKASFMNLEGVHVFLGQIQAAGTGINGLQSVCSDVVFAEQEWVPGSIGQAIDRLDRIGQKANYVTARILHAPGTLESAVLGARMGKGVVIKKLMADESRGASATSVAVEHPI